MSNIFTDNVAIERKELANGIYFYKLKSEESIVSHLVEHFGWEELGNIIPINCFRSNPGIKSSLTFLRKTPWARKKVEELYIEIVS
ncbi:MAG: DUF2132 domain-containing protein [Bacteroidetes bacterium]|nr:DUF2132 domain-containing protein [Bacteroidota bacterium]